MDFFSILNYHEIGKPYPLNLEKIRIVITESSVDGRLLAFVRLKFATVIKSFQHTGDQ